MFSSSLRPEPTVVEAPPLQSAYNESAAPLAYVILMKAAAGMTPGRPGPAAPVPAASAAPAAADAAPAAADRMINRLLLCLRAVDWNEFLDTKTRA